MEYKIVLWIALVALIAISEAAPQERPVETQGPRPEQGKKCLAPHADLCLKDGDCQTYWWCERDEHTHKGTGKNGTWQVRECDTEAGAHNLYWHPDEEDNTGGDGGRCDFWENLRQEVKDKYNADPACIDPHCEWQHDTTDECSGRYWYMHPDRTEGEFVEMNCPRLHEGEWLVWSQHDKGCLHCSRVEKADGSGTCC